MMNTTIRTICPACEADNAALVPADLLILDRVYQYRCPACGLTVRRQLNDRTESVLLAAGVDTLDDRVRRHSAILSDINTPADIE